MLCQNGETQESGDNETKMDVEFYSALLINLRRLDTHKDREASLKDNNKHAEF